MTVSKKADRWVATQRLTLEKPGQPVQVIEPGQEFKDNPPQWCKDQGLVVLESVEQSEENS